MVEIGYIGRLDEMDLQKGDVVEFVSAKLGYDRYDLALSGFAAEAKGNGGGVTFLEAKDGFSEQCGHTWKLISRASDAWQLTPPEGEYEVAKDSEGNTVAYRSVQVDYVSMSCHFVPGPNGRFHLNTGTLKDNAKLSGETRNGKPVGEWTIKFND